jgi:polyisoprenyl-teichoic acid--peptidoglycan teichoic acid transferase
VRRRAAIVVLSLTAWVAGSALGGLGPSIQANAQVSGIAIGKAHAGYTPSLNGSKPVVVLVVGSGARRGDDVLHSLADSMHLLFINPAKKHATVVGIPRDSYVSINGGGTNKINSSLVFGGPEGLVSTVEAVTGVHIDYWAITTFWGLINMINRLGGVHVDIPFSMHDSYSGANFEPGPHLLTGEQALAFARDRHSLAQGDFGRSEDGGRLLLALLTQFQKEYKGDASRVLSWISAGLTNSFSQMPLSEIMALAFTVSKVPLKNVQNVVLPGNAHTVGGLSVVTLDDSWKARIFNDVKADAILTKANTPPSPTAGQH